jgi:putative tryptophan/tyrosine transport system substrate-binding protein
VNRPPSPLNMLLSRHTRRREFITLVGGAAAAWPLTARAQQPALPVVGFLRSNSRAASADLESAFRDGPSSMGFVEGRNVTIDYQYAENQNDRLPAMAASWSSVRWL